MDNEFDPNRDNEEAPVNEEAVTGRSNDDDFDDGDDIDEDDVDDADADEGIEE